MYPIGIKVRQTSMAPLNLGEGNLRTILTIISNEMRLDDSLSVVQHNGVHYRLPKIKYDFLYEYGDVMNIMTGSEMMTYSCINGYF